MYWAVRYAYAYTYVYLRQRLWGSTRVGRAWLWMCRGEGGTPLSGLVRIVSTG